MIVAAGIASIIALGVAQMFADQHREVRALNEKLLIKDLEIQMKRMFSTSDYCNCVFRGKTFDTTASPAVIVTADQLTRLRTGYSVGPPTCTEIATDFIPPATSVVTGSAMTVGSIGLGPLALVVPGIYRADIEVMFANSVRSMKPIKHTVQFSLNMTGGAGPTARPFANCAGSAAVTGATAKGFCTPKVDWDNSNSLACGAVSGFTAYRMNGVYNATYRSTSCCYVPVTSGSPGWCSLPMEGWAGSFTGCGVGTANYDIFHMSGISSGSNDTHQCCFIPRLAPSTGFTDTFSTDHIGSNDASVPDCGGPYPDYNTIYQNVVAVGLGRNVSCTWYSR